MAHIIDNTGIGVLYASFSIHQTDGKFDLDITNIGNAVVLTGNNEVGLGSYGDQLLGQLVHVSDEIATVQIDGIVRFSISEHRPISKIGKSVVVNGLGGVCEPIPGQTGRGITLSINKNSFNVPYECDLFLHS